MKMIRSLFAGIVLMASVPQGQALAQVDDPEADARMSPRQMVERLDRQINVTPGGAPSSAQQAAIALPIQFEFNSERLTPQGRALLDLVAAALNDPQIIGNTFFVEGHTDAVGAPETNLSLSQRRARAVRDYLVGRAVAAGRLTPVGYGETRLIPGVGLNDGRNRRVRIVREL